MNSKIILTANYGNNFQIIGTIGDWFCINSNDNSANTTFYNKIYKVVFIKSSEVVNDKNIPLSEPDLNEILDYSASSGASDSSYKDIKVSFVTKEEYYAKKDEAITYLTKDSKTAFRVNKTLVVKVGDKQKKYTDDTWNKFFYVGRIKPLNYEVIYKEYIGDYGDDPSEDQIDESQYFFIDSKNGNTAKSFDSFPYLSFDKKNILSFRPHVFLNRYSISIYNLAEDRYFISDIFKNWVVVADEKEMFWGADNYFYLPILPSMLGDCMYNDKRLYEGDVQKYRYVKINIPPITSFSNIVLVDSASTGLTSINNR